MINWSLFKAKEELKFKYLTLVWVVRMEVSLRSLEFDIEACKKSLLAERDEKFVIIA